MSVREKSKHVFTELRSHAPFTTLGALTGIVMMLLFTNLSNQASYRLFYIFHPLHVVLSAMVTASLFRLHEKTKGFLTVLIVGYVGAIGTATLSDSILPFLGEEIMGVVIPTESAVHSQMHSESEPCENPDHEHHTHHTKGLHLGFIEEWYIVNPAAFLGIAIAYFLPRTKLPHALHILISTWASSAHIMMNLDRSITITLAGAILIVLFISVWLPCCFSDIIFPTLLVGDGTCQCHFHAHHNHKHNKQEAENEKS